MSGIQANTAAMNQNGQQTIANAESFQNELASLRNNVDSLMSIWKGVSATDFNQSFQEQANNLDEFGRLILELGESISRGASILSKAEEDNLSAGSHMF